MHMFARITKVDEERREVTGRAAQETIDRDGEIFDFDSSVPNFQKWSAECFADSRGLSRGNIRAMHGNVAAGVVKNIDFNQTEKAIDIVAKITDDAEWNKILTGTYQGFSIGGRYSRKWADISGGKTIQRYTAVPSEISIVDRPACPSALFFDIHKRDGSVIKKQFATTKDRSTTMSPELDRFLKNFGPAFLAIRKAHASRPQSLAKLFSGAREAPERLTDKTAIEIKKVHSAAGLVQVDERELRKMIKRGRLRKLALPEQSSNGLNDSVTANTGAANRFRDQTADGQTITSVMGGQSITGIPASAFVQSSNATVSTPNSPLLTDAIKRDLSRPKQWGAG